MNIALIHYSVPPVVGGVERVVAAQALTLARRGHSVRLVAGSGESLLPEVPLVRIPELAADCAAAREAAEEVRTGAPGPRFASLVARLRERIGEALADRDAVLIHNLLSMPFHPAATAALADLAGDSAGSLWAGRCFHWLHDAAYCNPDYRLPAPDRFPWALLARAVPRVRTIAVSEHRRRQWEGLAGAGSVEAVIPNGIDPCEWLELPPRIRAWALAEGWMDKGILLLHPTRIVRRKHIGFSIRVAAALAAAGSDALLLVTGAPDPHRPTERELGLELQREGMGVPVRFLGGDGPLTDAEVAALYRVADGLLFPSREEGFGIPPLEAALGRLPAFVSSAPALDELTVEHGIRFSPDADPTVVAAKIAAFLEQDAALRDRKRILRENAWDTIVRERIEPLLLRNGKG